MSSFLFQPASLAELWSFSGFAANTLAIVLSAPSALALFLPMLKESRAALRSMHRRVAILSCLLWICAAKERTTRTVAATLLSTSNRSCLQLLALGAKDYVLPIYRLGQSAAEAITVAGLLWTLLCFASHLVIRSPIHRWEKSLYDERAHCAQSTPNSMCVYRCPVCADVVVNVQYLARASSSSDAFPFASTPKHAVAKESFSHDIGLTVCSAFVFIGSVVSFGRRSESVFNESRTRHSVGLLDL